MPIDSPASIDEPLCAPAWGGQRAASLRLRTWAARHPRWGHRFLHWAVRQEGFAVNRKRVYRLYREEGLRIRRRRRKHVAAAPREAGRTDASERALVDGLHVGRARERRIASAAECGG